MTSGKCIIHDDDYVWTPIGFMLRLLFLLLVGCYVCYPFERLYIIVTMLLNCQHKFVVKEFCKTLICISSLFIPEYMSLQKDFNSILLRSIPKQI